jgi:hypothetical protein
VRGGTFVLYTLDEERRLKWPFELQTILSNLTLAAITISEGFAYSPKSIYSNNKVSPTKFFPQYSSQEDRFSGSKDVVLEIADLPTLRLVYERISVMDPLNKVDSEGFSRLRNALRFYSEAMRTHWYLMKIVLLFICLESLFSDQQDKTDISYKVRLRAARLLKEDLEERKTLFDDLKLGYDIRSSLLHGDNVAKKAEKGHKDGGYSVVFQYPEILQNYVREVLLKIISSGDLYNFFSSAPDPKKDTIFFNELVL